MTDNVIRDIARRIAARHYDTGIDPSYLKMLDDPKNRHIPLVRLIRAAIDVLKEARLEAHLGAPTQQRPAERG